MSILHLLMVELQNLNLVISMTCDLILLYFLNLLVIGYLNDCFGFV